MIISNKYMEASKKEKNNLEHKIKIYNVTRKKYITDYLENDDIVINRSLKENDSITPNSINLEFNFEKWETEKVDIYFDTPIEETNKKFNEYDIKFDKFPTKESLKLPINENDEIEIYDVFNEENIILFKGIADQIKIKEDFKMNKLLNVTIRDLTVKGYENKFSRDISYNDIYYYNSQYKENSILYLLVKQIGFKDEEIEIEEIKYKDNNYLKIPTVNLKKGSTIMKELVELVLSVNGNIYVTSNGKLKITSSLNQSDTNVIDYTFDGNNILNYFEVETIKPQNNKVEVKYTEYKQLPKQPIFILAGQNADYTTDDAKVIIRANTRKSNTYWKIEYITPNVAKIDENIEIKAYRYIDEKKQYIDNYNDYELDFEKMTLRFWNLNDYDIFIEKFKIYGEPVKEIKDNVVSYSEYNLEDINYNTLNINNKYINVYYQAQEVAKYKYYENCREYNQYKFETNSLPFLELEDVVTINFRNYNNKIQIQAIEQHKDKTIITAIDYEENKENTVGTYVSYKTNEYDENKYINNSYGSIKFDTNKPPKPLDLKVKSEVLGVKLNWRSPENYKEINGYYIYVSEINSNGIRVSNDKILVGNINEHNLKLSVGNYVFKISTLNFQGVESELTEEVMAKSLFLTANELQVDNNTLVFDTLNKIKLGMVYSNNISDKAITEGKVDVEAIRTENIYFGDNCGIRKDYEFDDTGIVYDENGKRKKKSDKLIIDGNIIFDKDVEFNGKIIGNKSLSVEDLRKKVVLENGSIFFEEKNAENDTFIRTRVIKKEKSGIYTYDPNQIRWIDVRDFSTQEWNDFTIKAALYSFNVDKDTKRVLCEVVRNENNKHLFYIKVGTISQIIDYPITENLTLSKPNKECNDYGNIREVSIYEKIFLNKNKINIEIPSIITAKYRYRKTNKMASSSTYNNNLGIVGAYNPILVTDINYTVYRDYFVKVYLSYRKKGSLEWSTPIESKNKDFSNIVGDIDIKLEVKLKYYYSEINNDFLSITTDKRATDSEEDKIVSDMFYNGKTIENYTKLSHTYSSLNMKITKEDFLKML